MAYPLDSPPPLEAPLAPTCPFLLVLIGSSPRIAAIPRPGALTIGRSRRCDVQLDEMWVSRHHARVMVDADGVATILDLASRAGTRVNFERISGTRLLVTGDRISIGSAALIFHAEGRFDRSVDAVAFPRFCERLQRLIDLAPDGGFVGVACARLDREVSRRMAAALLMPLLRPIDSIGWGRPRELFVRFAAFGRAEAEAICARIANALGDLADAVEVGYSLFPLDGSDAHELVAVARRTVWGEEAG
jgi:hypothetical protein